MDPSLMATDAMTHLTAGAAVVYFIQWAKKSNWPLVHYIGHDTYVLNRWISIVSAGLLAFGIHWTGDYTTGWVISVPPGTVLLTSAWEFAKQFTTQQMIYDTVTKRPVVVTPPTQVTINPPAAPPQTPGPLV